MANLAQISQILIQLKLSTKEAQVFLSLFKVGRATVAVVARDSGVTRTYVYGIVQTLITRGLVSEVEIRGVKHYEAVDYAGLLAFVSREQKELQTIEKKLQQMASEFNALQMGRQQKTKVRFFDGVEGIKNIYAEIERDCNGDNKPKELLTIFSPANLEKVLPNFSYFNFNTISGRDIVCEDELLEHYKKQITNNLTIKYKVWPLNHGLFPTDTIIWKNKIAYTDLVGFPSGIIIENEAIAKSSTMMFDGLWDGL